MKLISFDVGIKNMAYCIFSIDASMSIFDWNVLNLMDEHDEKHLCTFTIPPKTKKLSAKQCAKNAKYKKNDGFYCEKHAKACSQFIVPNNKNKIACLKKMKVHELLQICQSQNLSENTEKLLKKEMLELVIAFYEKKCFEPIVVKKYKTASETDLIHIGRNMQTSLDNINGLSDINCVIIENQISPIANRMKTIQGMLAQYFIMKVPAAKIEFVSSANKLKKFQKKDDAKNEMVPENTIVSSGYKKNKSDGIKYCNQIIDANPAFHKWKDSLNTKKKDDLADCFLQGIWYIDKYNMVI
jgi:hypothetical protein